MTPLEQLCQKPREVQIVLSAMMASRAMHEIPGHPTPEKYNRYAPDALAYWQYFLDDRPDLTELQIARGFSALMGSLPNCNWNYLVLTCAQHIP